MSAQAAGRVQRSGAGLQRLPWCRGRSRSRILLPGTPALARPTAWEQLTFFTDSAVYPALPDGRMLASYGWRNFPVGATSTSLLPSGDAVQLTHDCYKSGFKLAPALSPDGSRIAYGTVEPFDTWKSLSWAAAQILLRNAPPSPDRQRQAPALSEFGRPAHDPGHYQRGPGRGEKFMFLPANAAWCITLIFHLMAAGC
jgi:hypothetical protein